MDMGASLGAAGIPHADRQELGNAAAGSLVDKNLRLRHENQTLRATAERLREEVSRLQGCNWRLRSFNAEAALGPMEDWEEEDDDDDDGGERIHLLTFSCSPNAFRQALA